MKLPRDPLAVRKAIAANRAMFERLTSRYDERASIDPAIFSRALSEFPIRCTSFNHQPHSPRSCAADSAGDVSTSVVGVRYSNEVA